MKDELKNYRPSDVIITVTNPNTKTKKVVVGICKAVDIILINKKPNWEN